jgi:hypothetical protein
MAIDYQFPYSKVIREDGEVIPAGDHNKQEKQIECLTDAVGNYRFSQGSIESRITNISGDLADVNNELITINNAINGIQTDISDLDVRVTTLESSPPVGNLDDLGDVSVPAPAIGNILTYTVSGWTDAPPPETGLDGIDVNLTGIQDGDSIVFEAGTGTGDGVFRPQNLRVLIASGAPGDPNESEVIDVNEIRFLTDTDPGEQHNVIQVDDGIAYIGGIAPPDALSTLTGLTGLVTGRLSTDGSTTYPPTLSAGDLYSSITQNSSWTFDTTGSEFSSASLGNLILAINGVDVANVDLAVNFVEGNRATGQVIANYNTQGSGDPIVAGVVSFAGGSLTIVSVGPTGVIATDLYQRGAAQISLTAPALQTGYNIVTLRHVTSGTATATLEWFYDTDPAGGGTDPALTATDLVENTPVLKSLSGVDYYDVGSTFDLDITGVRLFNNAYHSSSAPITVATGWDGNPVVTITDPEVSGVSNPAAISETMTVSGLTLTVVPEIMDSDAQATSTPRDPYGTYSTLTTSSKNFVIMSVTANSTSIYDSFVDERYRLPNTTNFNVTVTGAGAGLAWAPSPALWNSSTSISGLGELQVYDHTAGSAENRLVYPTFDYSNGVNFQPQPNPDYSSIGPGTLTYYRVFRASDVLSKSNGIITFPGVAEADLAAGLDLRIKVPGKTMWLDLATAFNGGTFPTNAPYPTGTDGEGCRINSGVNSLDINNRIEFSLGTLGTDVTSDYQLILEITYASSAVTEIIGTGAGVSINW